MFFISIIAVLFGVLSFCQNKNEDETSLAVKMEKFDRFTQSIDGCKKLPLDTLFKCASTTYDLDTVENINHGIWLLYGRAKAFLHNRKEIEAIEFIDQALLESEQEELMFERAELLQLRSFIYSNSFKNWEAAEDLYKAAEIYLKLGLKNRAATSYLNIENLQFNSGNHLLAIENGRLAMKLIRENQVLSRDDTMRFMHAYNTLGLSYYKLNDYPNALRSYDSSYYFADRIKDEFWKGLVMGNTSQILFREGKLELARQRLEIDLKTSLTYNETSSACNAMLTLGEVLVAAGKHTMAKEYYDSAFYLMQTVNRPTLKSKYYKNISEWYRQQGDYRQAFFYYQKHIELQDSIKEMLTNSQLEKIQTEKKFEKQLADMHLIKAENAMRTKEVRFSRISIAGFVIILGLFSVLLITIKRNNKALSELNLRLEDKVKARTQRLKEINSELDTYLYRASHDVRRPILSIMGLAHVAELTNDHQERVSIHQHIKKTAHEMDNMLKKLQMAYELEQGKSKHTISVVSRLSQLINDLQVHYPSVVFKLLTDGEAKVKTYETLFDIAVANVLENACIFSSGYDQTIHVTTETKRDTVNIIVKDHGPGIEPFYLDKVFEPYTRYDNRSQGSGLGLYLAKKAITKLYGSISVKSTFGEGSEFMISLPIR